MDKLLPGRWFDHVPFVLAASAALFATAAVGCSQESNYCDETACYYCDGYGCRRLDPPTRASCECDYQCIVPGTECTSLGCTQRCDADADCPASARCRGGYCLTPSESVTDAACGCTTTADCPGDGVICRDGTCVRGCTDASDCDANQTCVDGSCVPTVNPPCSATNPCEGGLECVDGECRQPSDTCQFSSECGAGRICVNQRCTTACGPANPCATGAECVEGYCREIQPPPGECTTNDDCGAGRLCRDTRCFDECAADAECGTGRYCLEGRCRVDDRPRPSCNAMGDCAAGSICLNGSCRIPCTNVEECQRFDVQYNFCLMNVCATTNEATSNCASASDCSSPGALCVDGVCR
ncbi:MAG: hypothetical protein OHK0013_04610 [Sandaracinaceae bacterium]